MTMKLYEYVVSNDRQGWVGGYAIMLSRSRATDLFGSREIRRLNRIDHQLPDCMRHGLDALLETAPMGMVSFHSEIGWVPHVAPVERLSLYRIDVSGRDCLYAVSPNADLAAAIYAASNEFKEDPHRTFRIKEAFDDLPQDMKAGLANLLDFGPVGMVIHDKKMGWLLA